MASDTATEPRPVASDTATEPRPVDAPNPTRMTHYFWHGTTVALCGTPVQGIDTGEPVDCHVCAELWGSFDV